MSANMYLSLSKKVLLRPQNTAKDAPIDNRIAIDDLSRATLEPAKSKACINHNEEMHLSLLKKVFLRPQATAKDAPIDVRITIDALSRATLDLAKSKACINHNEEMHLSLSKKVFLQPQDTAKGAPTARLRVAMRALSRATLKAAKPEACISHVRAILDLVDDEDSAKTKVFGTYELLEVILLELPERDLLFAQRVCRTFKAVFDDSGRIQRKLFFRPQPEDSKFRFNELLFSSRVFQEHLTL